uniref:(northern house mosquito) hypothetical protein n=1 Tax=Culex pipiens TaxID=7175 RepID=A0A8D8BAY2_CULPI
MQLCGGGRRGRRFMRGTEGVEYRHLDRALPVEHGRIGATPGAPAPTPTRVADRRVDGRGRRVVIAGHVVLRTGRRRGRRRRDHDRRRQVDPGARRGKVLEHGQDRVGTRHLRPGPLALAGVAVAEPQAAQPKVMQSELGTRQRIAALVRGSAVRRTDFVCARRRRYGICALRDFSRKT